MLTEEEIQALEAELETAKNQVKERDAAFKPLEEELAEVKAQLTEKDEQLTAANASIEESSAKLATVTEGLGKAVESYKALVLSSNPDIPEELITGDDIEGISTSLETAKGIVGKIRASGGGGIPAGAPGRTPPDLSGMSPMAKIRYGAEHPPK
jgi:septation ring formation regulator EzrA